MGKLVSGCARSRVVRRAPGEPAGRQQVDVGSAIKDGAKCIQVFCTSDP